MANLSSLMYPEIELEGIMKEEKLFIASYYSFPWT